MINRRHFLLSVAGGLAAGMAGPSQIAGARELPRSTLGIADYSFNVRNKAERSGQVPKPLDDPLDFLKYCQGLGAGGVQIAIGNRSKAYTGTLREYAEVHNMFIEGSASLPRDASDVGHFQETVRTAKEAGAQVIRIAVGGRRYEQFDKAEQFKVFAERSWKSIQLAEPIAARQHMRLAIENHKDWRMADLLGMLKRLDSQSVGVCVDTNNSFALLEDPMEVVRAYAPWAFSVHLKDMAVCEYDDGFLLADVPLGTGSLDLPAMVELLRKARPEIRFSLEMATRDPLKVPCLTEKYWATFADVPGTDLVRVLRYVRAHANQRESLPRVSHLPLNEQVKLEEDNVKNCLRYASEHLSL